MRVCVIVGAGVEKKDEALMWETVKRVVEKVVGREEEVEYRRAQMGERVKVMMECDMVVVVSWGKGSAVAAGTREMAAKVGKPVLVMDIQGRVR